MKFRRSYIAFAFVLAPLAGMALVTACGGDNSPADAGPDATTQDVAKDVAPEASKSDASDASCANDVDLTQYLPSADASVDVDAGGLNIAECTGCFKTNCGSDINACNQDCACRQSVIDLVTCIGGGQSSVTTCLTDALGGDSNMQALIGCAISKCQSSCLTDGGTKTDSGSDSGSSDAADGG